MRIGQTRRAGFFWAVIVVIALLAAYAIVYYAGYVPGTAQPRGFGVWGTGTIRGYYDAGELKEEHYYVAGVLEYATWYFPDGSIAAQTDFDAATGWFYFMSKQGTVAAKVYMVDGMAEGEMTLFDAGGSVRGTREYRDGIRVR